MGVVVVLQRHRQLKIVQLTQMWIYRGDLLSNGSLVERLWFVRTVRAEQHGDVSRVERLWFVRTVRAEQHGDVSRVERLWFVRTVRAEQHGDVSRVERLWLYGPCSLNLSP